MLVSSKICDILIDITRVYHQTDMESYRYDTFQVNLDLVKDLKEPRLHVRNCALPKRHILPKRLPNPGLYVGLRSDQPLLGGW